MKHNKLFIIKWCHLPRFLQWMTCQCPACHGVDRIANQRCPVKWGKSSGSVTCLSNSVRGPSLPRVARNRLLSETETFALGVGENGVIKGLSWEATLSPSELGSGLGLTGFGFALGTGKEKKADPQVSFEKEFFFFLLFCRKNKTSSFTHGRNTWRFFCSCQWQAIPT